MDTGMMPLKDLVGKMSNIIERRKEMKWMQRIGIKGIKVDFIGSDKQVTMQLYEDILADANDYGLLVSFSWMYHSAWMGTYVS